MIRSRLLAPLLASAMLAGCSLAPAYHRPSVGAGTLPQTWKTAPGWRVATPSDAAPRSDWWTAFDDPTLNDLIARANAHNQTVAGAAANYREARAATREARASLFPTVSLDGSVTHTETGGSRTVVTGGVTSAGGSRKTTNYSLSVGATWEPDFFGRILNTVRNARFTEQARLADLANEQLAIQGELAIDYLSLRATDAQIASLSATVQAYQRALQINTNQYNAGVIARTAVFQAQSQLASAQSDLAGEQRTRAQYEDAIAVLIGEPAPSYALPPAPNWSPTVPAVPVTLPSALLERRPDVASAERATAAANAEIGVERAAFFPTVTLTGNGGFNNNALSGLFSAASSLWSVGASVAETLLDFGARSARVAEARAAYDAAVANYRQVALTAFQGVQDELIAAQVLARQEVLLQQAAAAANATEQSLLNQYRAGTVVYTDVVTAQATALNARISLIQAELDRQTAAVSLVQALGGGWSQADLTNGAGTRAAAAVAQAQPPR